MHFFRPRLLGIGIIFVVRQYGCNQCVGNTVEARSLPCQIGTEELFWLERIVTKMTAGDTVNVITNKGYILGTALTNNADIRSLILKRISEVEAGIAKAYGGKAETRIICNVRLKHRCQ